tara:strand:+ start:356 stop:859 length:504 start_codon:yes stop_codon:yes gene_type:complete
MAKTNSTLTVDRLKQILSYDKESGFFTRISNGLYNAPIGHIAKYVDSRGYIRVRVDCVQYLAHRLAWFYINGQWPEKDIDHKDRNKINNSWSNLRSVTRTVNSQNRKNPNRNNSTGYLGVTKTIGGKFQSAISVKGKSLYIGLFKDAEEAHNAYVEVKRKLHEGCTI